MAQKNVWFDEDLTRHVITDDEVESLFRKAVGYQEPKSVNTKSSERSIRATRA